ALDVKVCGSLPVTVKVRRTVPGLTVIREGLNRSVSVPCTCLACTSAVTAGTVDRAPGESDPEGAPPDEEHPAASRTAMSADGAIRAEVHVLTGRTVPQV